MNAYENVPNLKSILNITNSVDDVVLRLMLEYASRQIDTLCDRVFYLFSGKKYFPKEYPDFNRSLLLGEDLLVCESLKTDTDDDGSFDDETWLVDQDYYLYPYETNIFPKSEIHIPSNGRYSFPRKRRSIEITGLWGYGDGKTSLPFKLIPSATVTLSNSTIVSGTCSNDAVFAGDTYSIGLQDSESIYILTTTGNPVTAFTCIRGIGGTTSAAWTDATVLKVLFPDLIKSICLDLATNAFTTRRSKGLSSRRIGDYFEQISSSYLKSIDNLLTDFKRTKLGYVRS